MYCYPTLVVVSMTGAKVKVRWSCYKPFLHSLIKAGLLRLAVLYRRYKGDRGSVLWASSRGGDKWGIDISPKGAARWACGMGWGSDVLTTCYVCDLRMVDLKGAISRFKLSRGRDHVMPLFTTCGSTWMWNVTPKTIFLLMWPRRLRPLTRHSWGPIIPFCWLMSDQKKTPGGLGLRARKQRHMWCWDCLVGWICSESDQLVRFLPSSRHFLTSVSCVHRLEVLRSKWEMRMREARSHVS